MVPCHTVTCAARHVLVIATQSPAILIRRWHWHSLAALWGVKCVKDNKESAVKNDMRKKKMWKTFWN